MGPDVHEVYAIRYAHHERRSPENFLGGDPHDLVQPLDYYVWAIVGPHGAFVVDTGFDAAMGKKRQRVLLNPVREGLAAIGISPGTVKDVIITHLHYDHTGNYDLFPDARYHLQDIEIAYATGRSMCHPHLRLPFEVEDVIAMVRKIFAGRVIFHDGADEIAPGISVHRIGGHSKGLQCVRVATRRGHVVLASDATHLYDHIEQGRIFPIVYNVGDVLEGYATVKKLASSMSHIVPGHDPRVLERYPPPRSGLEDWIARLDVEPKEAGDGSAK
jgi:glyoxylase-like metal-dependent hydrolase (beta-lactamase superfamily II)